MQYPSKESLVDLVAGSRLEGCEIEAVPVEKLEHPLWVFKVPVGSDGFSWREWRLMRDMLPKTGCWPLIVGDDKIRFDAVGSSFAKFECDISELEPPYASNKNWLDRLAARKQEYYKYFDDLDLDQRVSRLDLAARLVEEACGVAPTDDELKSAVGSNGRSIVDSFEAAHEWLAHWMANRIKEAPNGAKSYNYRIDLTMPYGDEHNYYLALLPSAKPVAAALIGLFAVSDRDIVTPIDMVALLDRWNKRWGAEPVSQWSTIIDFHVRNPPRNIDEALEIGYEHYALGYNTVCDSAGPEWLYANNLIDCSEWQLHQKP